MSNIGNRLKQIRTEKRLTQEGLGKIISVTKQAIANIESLHNKPSVEIISKLIENLDVNANWFITGKGKMFNSTEPSDDELATKVRKILKDEGII